MYKAYPFNRIRGAKTTYQRALGVLIRVILTAVLPIVFFSTARAQHRLNIAVDGAKSPEKISDDLAWRHFLLSIAEKRNPEPHEVLRRNLRLKDIGLSKSDRDALISAVEGLREELDEVERLRREEFESRILPRENVLASLRSREAAAISRARASVGRLRPEGQERLARHIQTRIKSRIVVLSDSGHQAH